MKNGQHIIFLLNLLQDVNVIRPLAYLASREFDAAIGFLVSARFLERDILHTWQRELGQICAETGGSIHIYETPVDAVAAIQGKRGLLIAASESSLSTHADTHDVFRIAPPSFLRITLQHGYECVGFLQNREQLIAHGRNIKFAADVICGWCEAPALTSLANTEKPKLYVSGPPSVLNVAPKIVDPQTIAGGLVCENLHSARLKTTGDHGKSFMNSFFRFCERLDEAGQEVTLRPHPGGMSVIKNKVILPGNVSLNSQPMYKFDLGAYAFGISAPSTVVLDMVLAGIPVAVWRDEVGIMDASNYDGLTPIRGLDDWFEFARDAMFQREAIITQQQRFLDRLTMPTCPADVYGRFARLMAGGMPSLGTVRTQQLRADSAQRPRRVMFVVNANVPTLQLSFLRPLGPLFESGEMDYEILSEVSADKLFPLKKGGVRDISERRAQLMGDWIEERLLCFKPDLIVACRYSAPAADRVVSYARMAGVPLIYHIDDDLLNIPPEIGHKKFIAHNNPNRLKSVDTLLKGADLVYASTRKLKSRLRQLSYRTPIVFGPIWCSGKILSRAVKRPVTKVGYMGFDHAHDFKVVLAELVRYLRRNVEVEFEIFGSIPKPDELNEFGDRIRVIEPVRNYEEFMAVFATRQWDIGLCPLAPTLFNEVKANNKWVEYTCAGAAVLATRGMVYDDCCSDECGMLLSDGEWLNAMEYLTDNPDQRYQITKRAQDRVESSYSVMALQLQVLDFFDEARVLQAAKNEASWPHHPSGQLAKLASSSLQKLLDA